MIVVEMSWPGVVVSERVVPSEARIGCGIFSFPDGEDQDISGLQVRDATKLKY